MMFSEMVGKFTSIYWKISLGVVCMDYINPDNEISAWVERYLNLKRYVEIMEHVWKTDVSKDTNFQRTFNGFYQIRRNEEWRKCYYQLFEKMKTEYATFDDILHSLYENTGRIEVSFSSKMLATLHPNQPIWDKYVVHNLELTVPKKNIDGMVDVYEKIVEWYEGYIRSLNGQQCIKRFNEVLPAYAWISDVKKVDYFLWEMRK